MSTEAKNYALSPEQKNYINNCIAHAKELYYAEYVLELESLNERNIEHLFQDYLNEINTGRTSKETAVHALGGCFGQLLVEKLGFEWIIRSDEYGDDYAVLHKESDVIAFPHSSVQKRIEEGKTGSLAALFQFWKTEIEK